MISATHSRSYLTKAAFLGSFPPYDVNQDGKVDVFDLVLVGQHFGDNFITATPPADFGQLRSVSPEGELRLSMTPSVTDIRRLTVSIDTTTIEDLYGYHFSIQYDPTVLELLNISPSPVLASAAATELLECLPTRDTTGIDTDTPRRKGGCRGRGFTGNARF